jgi:hypothetical protein
MNTSIRPVGIDNIGQPKQIPIKPAEDEEPTFDFDKDLKEHMNKHEAHIQEAQDEEIEPRAPQEQMFYPQMPPMPMMHAPPPQNTGLFSDEKWIYITIFIGFVLGVLMGKSMSGPVVIRSSPL